MKLFSVSERILLTLWVGGMWTTGYMVAPILFTGAAYYLPYLPSRLNDQFMELGYHVYVLATQSPDVEATKPILYATVFTLLPHTVPLVLVENHRQVLLGHRLAVPIHSDDVHLLLFSHAHYLTSCDIYNTFEEDILLFLHNHPLNKNKTLQ